MKNHLSKSMSHFLRHHPQKLPIDMDSEGFVDIEEFMEKLNARGVAVTREELDREVATNDKKRFIIVGDRIRASQGHTYKGVKIKFLKKVPPTILYHGTTVDNYKKILKSGGLSPMKRHHVHLSDNLETANNVANRRRVKAIIIKIDAKKMLADKIDFFISDNGVWLVDEVKKKYFVEE